MIVTVAETMNISSMAATGILNRLVRDTAENIHGDKLNCAEDRRIRWTTYQNLELWHDSWDDFLVEYGFAVLGATGTVIVKDELKGRIINIDETCLSLDGSNGNRGGRPTVTYHDIRFPHLGQATSKSSLTTTMITGSSANGEVIPTHFQFQTKAQTEEKEAIRVECIWYMLSVLGTFGYSTKKSFPTSIGLNSKGGMDADDFFEYIKMTIMKLFPDAAPELGKWVVTKCDSVPGRSNAELLAYMRFHGFLLFPGVPNTTAVTQETDQNYGPFQSAFRLNLQVIIDARIENNKSTSLAPWMVGLIVFGGEDPDTGAIIHNSIGIAGRI